MFSRIVWIIAILTLAAILIFANTSSTVEESPSLLPASEDLQTEDAALIPIGQEVGMRAPTFIAPVYGSSTYFNLAQQQGKVVVLNFWANGCNKSDEMIAELYHAICQFAKRQETWFRRMERKGVNIHWLPLEGSKDQRISDAEEYIRSSIGL